MGGAVVIVEAKSLPLGDEVAGNGAVVGSSSGVTSQVGDNRHGLDTNHTLEGKVGLVTNEQSVSIQIFQIKAEISGNIRKRTSKVISRDLVGWVQRLGDQVLGPLVEELVVVLEEGSVVGSQVILEGHDKHITTLLQWHLLIRSVGVTGSVGVVRTEIVHRPAVGVLASLLVDEQWLKQHLH